MDPRQLSTACIAQGPRENLPQHISYKTDSRGMIAIHGTVTYMIGFQRMTIAQPLTTDSTIFYILQNNQGACLGRIDLV